MAPQKINTLKAIENRMLGISHPQFHNVNLRKLHTTFINTGYPSNVVRKILYNTTAAIRSQGVPTSQHPLAENEDNRYYEFPTIPALISGYVFTIKGKTKMKY